MPHVRRLPGIALLAAALAAALGGCGHRGDPRPPLRHTPPPLQEFRLAQRGTTLELSVLAPAASVDGIAYQSLAVEFLLVEGPKDLEKAGARRALLAVPRERVVDTRPLPAPGTVVRAAARGVFEKDKGPRTLTMGLVTQPVVAAPGELVLSLVEDGVRLTWSGEIPKPVTATIPRPRLPGMLEPAGRPAAAGGLPSAPAGASAPGSTRPTEQPRQGGKDDEREKDEKSQEKEEPQTGFLVYRRLAGASAYGETLTQAPLEKHALKDTKAPQGAKVCYVVRAAASLDPLVESAASNEACLDVRDIAPPAVPTGLAVLPRETGLELVWTPSPEEDLASYRVYREAAGEPRRKLADVDPARAAWTDASAKPGVTYQYSLSAVDRSGNESAASAPVEAIRP